MATPTLYGRESEMETLRQWAVEERCRVIALLGLGGIGKSSLAVTFAKRVLNERAAANQPFGVPLVPTATPPAPINLTPGSIIGAVTAPTRAPRSP